MSDRKPRAFAYVRVSTDRQENSKEAQQDRIREYVKRRDLGVDDVSFFVDTAVSGKVPLDERKAGGELFNRMRRGDHLIVTKIDRAFRSTADCALKVITMNERGIRLHIIDFAGDAIDIGTPHGRMFLHMLAAFAEYERELISQRTKEGLAHRKGRGHAHSRFAGYGFRWEKQRVDGQTVKIKVRDDDEREVMGSIVAWRVKSSLSWEQIRQHLMSLKVRTRDGKEWDCNRIRRAFAAELQLQGQEQRSIR